MQHVMTYYGSTLESPAKLALLTVFISTFTGRVTPRVAGLYNLFLLILYQICLDILSNYLPVEDSPPFRGRGIPFYLSKFVSILGNLFPDRGVKGPFWVCLENGPVQEDINPSIYIIDLTPLVYKNLTSYRSIFFK